MYMVCSIFFEVTHFDHVFTYIVSDVWWELFRVALHIMVYKQVSTSDDETLCKHSNHCSCKMIEQSQYPIQIFK